jgi:predicted DNA-binding transcriptional regulator
MNLIHLKPGDKIAIPIHARSQPHVQHEVLTITRTTATQIVAETRHGLVFRSLRADGRLVCDHVYAVEATPELLAEHKKEVAALERWLRSS